VKRVESRSRREDDGEILTTKIVLETRDALRNLEAE
jgi:hypothetical protein